jgi:hypothetical protein
MKQSKNTGNTPAAKALAVRLSKEAEKSHRKPGVTRVICKDDDCRTVSSKPRRSK